MISEIARVNGINLHYRDWGPKSGPVVVFSNSLGTDMRVWDGVVDAPHWNFRTIVYDKRGHGLSDCPGEPWTIADLSRDLEELLERLGLREVILCGLSVGGMIVQDLAARRPEIVSGLVLCDTAARIGDDELWNRRIEAVNEAGLESIADSILERWFSPGFRYGNPAFHKWKNMLIRTPRTGYVHTCAAIRDADLTDATSRIRLPAIAVAGELDGATPPLAVEEFSRLIEGCRFEIIPSVGHLPCVEAPDIVRSIIIGLASRLGDRNG